MLESRRLPYTVHELYDAPSLEYGETVVVARVVCGERERALHVGLEPDDGSGTACYWHNAHDIPREFATFVEARDDAWRRAHIIGQRLTRG